MMPFLILVMLIVQSCNYRAVDGFGGKKVDAIYGINVGGDSHVDSYGVRYQKDPSKQGITSDFGKRLDIHRVDFTDQILYQTERYSHSSFGYDLPVKEDGSFVLVLKFSEVYFQSSRQKIFSVALNSVHQIVEDLDIFANVGYATAHDEIIPFQISDSGKRLIVGTTSSKINNGKIRLEFVKGAADNPKVNAFYIARGTVDDVPSLTPLKEFDDRDEDSALFADDGEEEDENYLYSDEDDIQFRKSDLGYEGSRSQLEYFTGGKKVKIPSGPPATDPWDFEPPGVVYLPLLVSVGASVTSFLFLRVVNKIL